MTIIYHNRFIVLNVMSYGGYVLHIGTVEQGVVRKGDRCTCNVDYERRMLIAPNHTLTHVMNWALRRVLHERGYEFFLETPTNQQFVILPNEDMARIREHASIEYWEKYDETHTVVRFCTSWATTQEDIDALAAVL